MKTKLYKTFAGARRANPNHAVEVVFLGASSEQRWTAAAITDSGRDIIAEAHFASGSQVRTFRLFRLLNGDIAHRWFDRINGTGARAERGDADCIFGSEVEAREYLASTAARYGADPRWTLAAA